MKAFLVVVLMIASGAVFARRAEHLLRMIRRGKAEERLKPAGRRLAAAWKQSVLQLAQFRIKTADYTFAGLIHILILAGFFVLLPGEIEFVLNGLWSGFTFQFLGNPLYPLFLFSQDLFLSLVILAVLLAFFRRVVLRPAQLNYHPSAFVILGLILVLMLTMLGLNVLHLADTRTSEPAGWTPIAQWVLGATEISGPHPIWFHTFWWLHFLVLLFFLNYLLYSKHLHVLTAIPANYFKVLPPKLVQLPAMEFESETDGPLGVSKLEHLSWKQLFDGFTCTECGRCTDQCPAHQTGKALSPREIILDIRDHLLASKGKGQDPLLVGEVIRETVLWECTTCGACAHVCPVGNEHLRDILEMRRYLAMEQGQLPEIMSRAIRSLETRSRPFYGTGMGADDWKKGLSVPVFEAGKTQYLLWLGCATLYEERAQKIARAMVRLLQAASVSFGILEQPRCTGDPAKQMGNEFLFQEIATQNIADFDTLGVQRVITLCPHCYHSFIGDYPDLGGHYEVIPHVVLTQQLLASGALTIKASGQTICYHDPCYLARHHGILDAPRAVMASAGHLIEAPSHGKGAFCCGAGGGNFWSEETGTRINDRRAKEMFDTGADIVATSCPFCMAMLTDGMKKLTEKTMIYDIAEIIDRQLDL